MSWFAQSIYDLGVSGHEQSVSDYSGCTGVPETLGSFRLLLKASQVTKRCCCFLKGSKTVMLRITFDNLVKVTRLTYGKVVDLGAGERIVIILNYSRLRCSVMHCIVFAMSNTISYL